MLIELKAGEVAAGRYGLCLNLKDVLRKCLVHIFVAWKSGERNVKLVHLGKPGGIWEKRQKEKNSF